VQEAGHEGVDRKAKPWEVDPGLARAQHERTRKAAAALIGADADDVALIPSVSYGVAVAGKIFAPPAGTRARCMRRQPARARAAHASPQRAPQRSVDATHAQRWAWSSPCSCLVRADLSLYPSPHAPPAAPHLTLAVRSDDGGLWDKGEEEKKMAQLMGLPPPLSDALRRALEAAGATVVEAKGGGAVMWDEAALWTDVVVGDD
jgi:hypothetical protein